jgi:hypothetical protein
VVERLAGSLAEADRDGWELFQVVPGPSLDGDNDVLHYFRRAARKDSV